MPEKMVWKRELLLNVAVLQRIYVNFQVYWIVYHLVSSMDAKLRKDIELSYIIIHHLH